jgi:hypothetical protein
MALNACGSFVPVRTVVRALRYTSHFHKKVFLLRHRIGRNGFFNSRALKKSSKARTFSVVSYAARVCVKECSSTSLSDSWYSTISYSFSLFIKRERERERETSKRATRTSSARTTNDNTNAMMMNKQCASSSLVLAILLLCRSPSAVAASAIRSRGSGSGSVRRAQQQQQQQQQQSSSMHTTRDRRDLQASGGGGDGTSPADCTNDGSVIVAALASSTPPPVLYLCDGFFFKPTTSMGEIANNQKMRLVCLGKCTIDTVNMLSSRQVFSVRTGGVLQLYGLDLVNNDLNAPPQVKQQQLQQDGGHVLFRFSLFLSLFIMSLNIFASSC